MGYLPHPHLYNYIYVVYRLYDIHTYIYIYIYVYAYMTVINGFSLHIYIPYSGKFWIGAYFRIFRMMPRRMKIKSMKNFTHQILNVRSPTWKHGDRAMALYRYFQPSCYIQAVRKGGMLAKLGGVAFPRTKIRIRTFYSKGVTAVYTKIYTSQNFLLYSIYIYIYIFVYV